MGGVVSSFHPRRLSPMLRATYARELLSWFFLPLMLGTIEGGTIAIVVKKSFTGAEGVEESALNLAVTILIAAPNFANLTSFVWAAVSRGRPKVPFISALQIATAILVCLIAFAPSSVVGLWMVTALAVIARTCWTGVITLRTAVWRNNYPNASRAAIAGKLAIVQALMLALAGFVVGESMDWIRGHSTSSIRCSHSWVSLETRSTGRCACAVSADLRGPSLRVVVATPEATDRDSRCHPFRLLAHSCVRCTRCGGRLPKIDSTGDSCGGCLSSVSAISCSAPPWHSSSTTSFT